MKKLMALVLALTMGLSLVACGGKPASEPASAPADASEASEASEPAGQPAAGGTDIAFVTDVGNIDDNSFNQFTYEGVTKFCKDNNLNANYFRPAEDTDEARLKAMSQAIEDGAKTVVMAGFLFAPTLRQAQEKWPDVQFLALDVASFDMMDKDADGKPTSDPIIKDNTALITYKEEQSGYLAGYAAVADGYKDLGFLGGMAVPAVVRFGQGFVQGADAAAKDLGIDDVNIKYWYSGSFGPTDEIKAKMDGWYAGGTEAVFVCGGGIYISAVDAATANDGKIIGVDVDQSSFSEQVITSATKGLAESVQLALTDCMNNGWKWSDTYKAKETTLGAAENSVSLPMATSQFTTFDEAKYNELYKGLADGTIAVDNNSAADAQFATEKVKVSYEA